ncbi:S41 family peptidase [Acetivibrio mesophilus]|uniref:S41 family peptidase n=1 Tax=Acetivibrio mesophilus TaxID=2487273 RepID=A0A4Q0I3T6_9FIRM|nr:S41 family peptidase [Acetivibrio mesophilus]RXE58940.1 S41 family peptidase [Acetivibrio mesophilus]HHV28494.1 S41 family peptidase [Clostridium sp.]
MNKNIFTSKFLPILLAALLASSATAYGMLLWHYKNPAYVVLSEDEAKAYENKVGKKFNPEYAITFDKNSVDFENIQKYNEVKRLLNGYYYEEVNQNDMLEGSIAGMVDSLKDPYTVYFTKEQMKVFDENTTGSYVGIGVSLNMDEEGLLTIVEAFPESPAKDVGMMSGDKIVKVDNEDVTTIRDQDYIISKIKGEENTKVKITVFRPSEGTYLDFDIIRKKIKIENITSEVMDGNIGYIKINMFDSEIAKYFGNHLNGLVDKNIKGLIIDLRDNPGGDYNEVCAIADRLLPEGLIVYTEDKLGNRSERRSDSTELNMPLVILVNGYSASASEILSGAVKDHDKGTLIGTKTFGKGLVQAVQKLEDGSGLKVTVARYFTPSGVCIHKEGIEPDIVIELDEKYSNLSVSQVPREDDVQLKKALEVIHGQID